MPNGQSRRHPLVTSLIGAGVGLLAGLVVFAALLILSPLVVVESHGEGKGGFLVEIAWLFLGTPACIVVGALWPFTIGRLCCRTSEAPEE